MQSSKLYVVKRDGSSQAVRVDKITRRIEKLCAGLDHIDAAAITLRVVSGIYPGVTTAKLDEHAADVAASMTYVHHDFSALAARILISNLHKKIEPSFSHAMRRLRARGLVTSEFFALVEKHAQQLDAAIDHDLDFEYKFFGFKTLEHAYLLKIDGEAAERPQHMLMRVSLAIHGEDLMRAVESYRMMSRKLFTHASPTLFSAGTPRPQLSSCFLLGVREDSIRGIYATLGDCAAISKFGGGIGLNVHAVRAAGGDIRNTNGSAGGLEPMLRVFNNMVRHVDQGGKRKGALAVYLEPWHADVFDFLNLRKNMGAEDKKARDLMYALWIPDLFMRRVHEDGPWSLMCPDQCPGLADVYGEAFDVLYARYERQKRFVRRVAARELWKAIIVSQVETGTPYMLYKDACNRKNNQRNLGTLRCSNLCAEIMEYTAPDETAVCNLASISVNKFVTDDKSYDFEALRKVTRLVVRNLDRIIDINYYPLDSARTSNYKHRPVGVGIQGLADAFVLLRLPYESVEAQLLNKQIAETIYYGALEASAELARERGPYESYEGSPASRGQLQFDLWQVRPTDLWDWQSLRDRIKTHGLRNSLLVAYMPTASTAQILGHNEAFEPFTSNVYVRRVLAGEFQVVNQYLMNDLIKLNLWDDDMRQDILRHNGSVQRIDRIPQDIKLLYKTVWEMKVRTLIDMSADRGAFIDQSQSFNIFVDKPTYPLLNSIHRHAWARGLKTGMYYLRTKPAANAIQFTVTQQPQQCGRDEVDCASCQV